MNPLFEVAMLILCVCIICAGVLFVFGSRHVYEFMVERVIRSAGSEGYRYSPWSYWALGLGMIGFGSWGSKTLLITLVTSESSGGLVSGTATQTPFGLFMICLLFIYGLAALLLPRKLIRWSFRIRGALESRSTVATYSLVVYRVFGLGLMLFSSAILIEHFQ
jgi:hypothetical protein